ncbi:unnamed protein product, partial [Ixodes persulcatus]
MAACSSSGWLSFSFSHSYGYRYFMYLHSREPVKAAEVMDEGRLSPLVISRQIFLLMTSTRPPLDTTRRYSSYRSSTCLAMIGILFTGVPAGTQRGALAFSSNSVSRFWTSLGACLSSLLVSHLVASRLTNETLLTTLKSRLNSVDLPCNRKAMWNVKQYSSRNTSLTCFPYCSSKLAYLLRSCVDTVECGVSVGGRCIMCGGVARLNRGPWDTARGSGRDMGAGRGGPGGCRGRRGVELSEMAPCNASPAVDVTTTLGAGIRWSSRLGMEPLLLGGVLPWLLL